MVDFAVRPWQGEDGAPVWLPIDAKFPNEDYERLLDAQRRADPLAAELAAWELEQRIRLEARSIADKYLEPPYTTDFCAAVPADRGPGHAEVLRRPAWSSRCSASTASRWPARPRCWPCSMRCRWDSTLALEKRSSEVWQVLGAVRPSSAKFGDQLARVKAQTQTVLNSLEGAEVRSRAMGGA